MLNPETALESYKEHKELLLNLGQMLIASSYFIMVMPCLEYYIQFYKDYFKRNTETGRLYSPDGKAAQVM